MRDNRGEWYVTDLPSAREPAPWTLMVDVCRAVRRSAEDVWRLLSYRSDLYRSRQDLRALSDEHLRDIGLTRRQAENEASRAFFED